MYQGRTQKAKTVRSGVYAETMRTYRHRILPALGLILLLLVPSVAWADFTAFLGVNPTPVSRGVRGLALGTGLIIVGFEFEYAGTSEDVLEAAPSLRTFMFNGLLQTPVPIARMQFYGTLGGGAYRETLGEDSKTNFGLNVGGGVKVTLVGPLRLRFDYRAFTLKGDARHPRPQRFYAGVNLKF